MRLRSILTISCEWKCSDVTIVYSQRLQCVAPPQSEANGDVPPQRHTGYVKFIERYLIAHRARYKKVGLGTQEMSERLYDHYQDTVVWDRHLII
jgi:hypothetical protein